MAGVAVDDDEMDLRLARRNVPALTRIDAENGPAVRAKSPVFER
jgi:hypothetical protein